MATKKKLKGGVQTDPSIRVKVKSRDLVVRDPEVPEKKKKKKKKSSLLAVSEKVRRISKLDDETTETTMGTSAESIQQLLEEGDNDHAIALIYKKLMQTLVDTIPYAEAQIRNTKGAKGVYQINSLISSIRELMTDIQMAQDRSALGTRLLSQVIQPCFLNMAMQTLTIYTNIAADAKAVMSEKEYTRFAATLREHRDRNAHAMNSGYKTIQEGTIEFLEK